MVQLFLTGAGHNTLLVVLPALCIHTHRKRSLAGHGSRHLVLIGFAIGSALGMGGVAEALDFDHLGREVTSLTPPGFALARSVWIGLLSHHATCLFHVCIGSWGVASIAALILLVAS